MNDKNDYIEAVHQIIVCDVGIALYHPDQPGRPIGQTGKRWLPTTPRNESRTVSLSRLRRA
ncbi:MAG: hypothetical protein AB7T01_06405 [Acidithiobacillus sp.]